MALTTVGLTRAEMAERLRLYREQHVIMPVAVNPPLIGQQTYLVCRHDSIRILTKRGNVGRAPWRHDPDEIKALAEGVQG